MEEYKNWFKERVNSTEYLGTDLAKAAWDHQQQKLDKAILKMHDFVGLIKRMEIKNGALFDIASDMEKFISEIRGEE